MIQHLSGGTMRHPLYKCTLLLVSAITSALIATTMGMSLYWLGLIPGQALLVGSAWMGVLACYLFSGRHETKGEGPKSGFLGRVILLMSGFLLFLACGSRIAAKNTKELLSQKGYTTFTASGTATIPPVFLNARYRPNTAKYKNRQQNLKHKAVVAVHILRMYNEDLPRDLLLFLIVMGGITATGLSVLMASMPDPFNGVSLYLGASALSIFSLGVWAGAAILTIMVIKKLTNTSCDD
ncbi:MAG: hypothetical protein AAF990_14805 [Bacteroidota bacterium]